MHLSQMADSDVDALHRAMGALSVRDDEPAPKQKCVFRFFDLPTELRMKIYDLALVVPDQAVDLDPSNYRRLLPRMQCFRVSKQMHAEAAAFFYRSNTIRLFPTHGRFFHTKRPLLARLESQHRSCITSVELRLGPGWSAPPRCQKVDDTLGLEDCVSLRTLKVFVELDPNGDIFNGFRGRGNGKEFYKAFCTAIVSDIFSRVPSIIAVELDAFPSVSKDSPLVLAILDSCKKASKKVIWGPLRGWEREGDCGQLGLENDLAGMSL